MDFRPTVLYVDDEPDIREAMTNALRLHYNVVGMPDGAAAWEALLGGVRPDVVVLDLHLAGMSGYRLIANIRDHEDLAHLPIVLLSGDVQLPDVAAALGIDDFLEKPATIPELRRMIGSVLGL
jgi:CheY-like chemotaxis protein